MRLAFWRKGRADLELESTFDLMLWNRQVCDWYRERIREIRESSDNGIQH